MEGRTRNDGFGERGRETTRRKKHKKVETERRMKKYKQAR